MQEVEVLRLSSGSSWESVPRQPGRSEPVPKTLKKSTILVLTDDSVLAGFPVMLQRGLPTPTVQRRVSQQSTCFAGRRCCGNGVAHDLNLHGPREAVQFSDTDTQPCFPGLRSSFANSGAAVSTQDLQACWIPASSQTFAGFHFHPGGIPPSTRWTVVSQKSHFQCQIRRKLTKGSSRKIS